MRKHPFGSIPTRAQNGGIKQEKHFFVRDPFVQKINLLAIDLYKSGVFQKSIFAQSPNESADPVIFFPQYSLFWDGERKRVFDGLSSDEIVELKITAYRFRGEGVVSIVSHEGLFVMETHLATNGDSSNTGAYYHDRFSGFDDFKVRYL